MTRYDIIQMACHPLSVACFVVGNMNVPHTTFQVVMLGMAALFQGLYWATVKVEKKHMSYHEPEEQVERIPWVSKGLHR